MFMFVLYLLGFVFFFFFFQAEDGIRDDLVTGVQTCALPIWPGRGWRWSGAGGEPCAGRTRHRSGRCPDAGQRQRWYSRPPAPPPVATIPVGVAPSPHGLPWTGPPGIIGGVPSIEAVSAPPAPLDRLPTAWTWAATRRVAGQSTSL